MTSVRPYRPSLSVKHAMRELEEGKGVQFDGEIVPGVPARVCRGDVAPIRPRSYSLCACPPVPWKHVAPD